MEQKSSKRDSATRHNRDTGRTRLQVTDADDWVDIIEATERIADGHGKRIDGEGWKVYMVGSVVRIDVFTKESN
jgi:hypothetical protein